eukprot:scaffold260344_cov17-Prasinocladus_malaysianus.AAC.1
MNVYTARQFGARLNIFARYRYNVNEATGVADAFDYREMRKEILAHIDCETSDVAENEYWEVLNRAIAWKLLRMFPIAGLSLVIQEPLHYLNQFGDCSGERSDVLLRHCNIVKENFTPECTFLKDGHVIVREDTALIMLAVAIVLPLGVIGVIQVKISRSRQSSRKKR